MIIVCLNVTKWDSFVGDAFVLESNWYKSMILIIGSDILLIRRV